ncbi:MAG: hypothetical protein PHH26_09370 [Candidatus Thermoplasmatota archaeon]|nr:hypothetical protein [Candidatus Thermoplasmatota archaeon]
MRNLEKSRQKLDSAPKLNAKMRLALFAGISTLIIAICILVYIFGPPAYVYENSDWGAWSYTPDYNTTKWNILLDAHSHEKTNGGLLTYGGDGGYLTPEQNILWHISLGYNAMILTDHNTYENVEETIRIAEEKYASKIVVLPGCEWTTTTIHCNLVFPPDAPIESYSYIVPPKGEITNETIRKMINQTHAAGGIVIVNHIPWTLRVLGVNASREALLSGGADYIEIVNQNEWDNDSYKFCLENGMGMVFGSDMHWPVEVYGYTLMNASSFTAQAVFDELKNKRTEVLYIPHGTPYEVEHKLSLAFVALRPLMQIGAMFAYYIDGIANIDWMGLGVFLAYLYVAFGILELFREKTIQRICRECGKRLSKGKRMKR